VPDRHVTAFPGAWHFIARQSPGGPPPGCTRLSTPDTGHLFRSRACLGDERYEELPVAEGFAVADTDLGHREKAGLPPAVADADRISPEPAASFGELGRTLSSRPQPALAGEAARRILLGRPCGSGRFSADFAEQPAPARNVFACGAA
jgi:hypothetical protein